ncbi:hypothetical protein BPORC_2051 [Bifidobacterium porcinum]|nr:hypothetical protein BPORC_2051 [Bifidobacterium porcinum]
MPDHECRTALTRPPALDCLPYRLVYLARPSFADSQMGSGIRWKR